MRTCPSCGGVIGRDCFNPEECAWIGEQQERQATRETQTRLAALERKMITPDPRNSVEVNEVLLNELNDCKDRIDVMRDERDAISKRLTEAQLHEVETHDELGAIIGNDDSLAECARRVVRERDEERTLTIYLKRDQDILRESNKEWEQCANRLMAEKEQLEMQLNGLCSERVVWMEKYDELREFVRLITLQLQTEVTPEKATQLFNYAYRMYVKHDVERRNGIRTCSEAESVAREAAEKK